MPSILNIGVCLNKVIFFKKIRGCSSIALADLAPLQTPLSPPVSKSELLTYPPTPFDRMILEQHIHIYVLHPKIEKFD